MLNIILIIVYLFLYFVAIKNIKYAVFFFVFFLIIKNVVEYKILGLFTFNLVFYLILFYHIIQKGYLLKIFQSSHIYLKPLISFTFVYVLIVCLNDIRQGLLLEDYLKIPMTINTIINIILRNVLGLINFIFLIKFGLRIYEIRNVAYKAMISAVVFLVLTIYFSPLIDLVYDVTTLVGEDLESFERQVIFFSGGDVNSFSTTINFVLCMILSQTYLTLSKINFRKIVLIILLITGVFFTASRMGFVTMVFVFLYFMLFMQIQKRKGYLNSVFNFLLITLGGITVYFLVEYIETFQLVFQRIIKQGLTDEIESEGLRYIRWIRFLNFSFEDPIRVLFGSNEILYVYGRGVFRDPHNFFIRTLYLNGIIPVVFFIYYTFKLYVVFKKVSYFKLFIFFIIPIFISLMIISQTVFILYFVLFSASLINDFIIKKEKLSILE